jgi:hypothetical protein
MNRKTAVFILFTQGITVVGAILAVASMIKMSGGISTLGSLATLWVLLPFAIASATLAKRPSSAGAVLALLLGSLFGGAGYYDLLFPSSRMRSTAALAYIFIPLWQTIWCLCAAAFSLAVDFRKDNARCPNCSIRFATRTMLCPSCGADRREFQRESIVLGPPAGNPDTGYRCPACDAEVNFGRSRCDACGQLFDYHRD